MKGTNENAMEDRVKKYMLSNWKKWGKPEHQFRIPVHGYIQKVKDSHEDISDDDFIDFSSDNFLIDRLGQVTANLNFFGKIPTAKVTGHFSQQFPDKFKSEFTLEWIPGTEAISRLEKKLPYNPKDFTGKTTFVVRLTADQMGFTNPSIKGVFDQKSTQKNGKAKYNFHVEFRDLSPYRTDLEGIESSGDVLYINNRFITNWVFGIQFTSNKPRFLNGRPFLYKPKALINDPECEKTKRCIEQYFQCILSDFNNQISNIDLFILKRFTNPTNQNSAYQLEGKRYCSDTDLLKDVEVFSANPNHPKWDSQKFQYFDAFYEGKELKPVEGNFEITEKNIKDYQDLSIEKYAEVLINKSTVENRLLEASAFYLLLDKATKDENIASVRQVMERVGKQFIGLTKKGILAKGQSGTPKEVLQDVLSVCDDRNDIIVS